MAGVPFSPGYRITVQTTTSRESTISARLNGTSGQGWRYNHAGGSLMERGPPCGTITTHGVEIQFSVLATIEVEIQEVEGVDNPKHVPRFQIIL